MLGFLTMAVGAEKYMKQAVNLAISLKIHMPSSVIAVITDHSIVDPIFDIVVKYDGSGIIGVVNKIDIYEFSPFDETVFIDADCLVSRPFLNEIGDIRKYDVSPIVETYLGRGGVEQWLPNFDLVLDELKLPCFPKYNGGLYFFRKSQVAEKVFKEARSILEMAERLHIKNFDRAGPNDETLLGLALAGHAPLPLYDDHGTLMRTPVGLTGNLYFEFFNGCHFIKSGKEVRPAILHFCGGWASHPVYVEAEKRLRALYSLSPGAIARMS